MKFSPFFNQLGYLCVSWKKDRHSKLNFSYAKDHWIISIVQKKNKKNPTKTDREGPQKLKIKLKYKLPTCIQTKGCFSIR